MNRADTDNHGPGPSECWGWELRTAAASAAREPFTELPPGPRVVGAGWARRAAASRDRVAQLPAHLVGWFLVTALFVTGAWAVNQFLDFLGGVERWIGVGLLVLAALTVLVALRPLALPVWTDIRYRRWLRRCLRAEVAQAERSRDWERRRGEHEYAQDAHSDPERWVPVRPVASRRVDVYGGDPPGNAALLTRVASSLVDSGARVSVVDISQDGIGHDLIRATAGQGHRVVTMLVPDHLATESLFAGMAAEDIGVAIAEAVHASDRGDRAADDKTLDATLVEQVCACLEPPVTFARLVAAFGVVTDRDDDDGLSAQERGALMSRLGEGVRQAGQARLFRLAAALRRLASVEANDPGAADDEAAALRVWELSERVGDLAGDLLAQLLFQVIAHRLKVSEPAEDSPVWIIAGADRIRRAQLERLDQLARRRGVRLILFFRHLREDAVEVLGGGDSVVFMRLGNAKEAEHAATFIGKEHRLVAGQFTASRSVSWSTTTSTSTTESESEQESVSQGKQRSRSRNYRHTAMMDFPHHFGTRSSGTQESTTHGTSASTSTSESTSKQSGGSTSDSVTQQRVYEYAVEPRTLQSLSSTAFVLVDPQDPGTPRLGDCAPELAGSADTSGTGSAHAIDQPRQPGYPERQGYPEVAGAPPAVDAHRDPAAIGHHGPPRADGLPSGQPTGTSSTDRPMPR